MKSLRPLWTFLSIMTVLSLAAGAMLPHHGEGLASGFGFFAWFGFASCLALIVVALALGFVLKRKEDYYDE